VRRFSQRGHLVTLSEINITPLLDLAFVLLIIFIITTPLLEKGLELKLPHAGGQTEKVDKSDIRTVEISNLGYYYFNKQRTPLSVIISRLSAEFRSNPDIVVYIRADASSRYDLLAQLIDGCQHNGITRYSLRTDPSPRR